MRIMKQNLLENIDIIGQRIKDIIEAIIKKKLFGPVVLSHLKL